MFKQQFLPLHFAPYRTSFASITAHKSLSFNGEVASLYLLSLIVLYFPECAASIVATLNSVCPTPSHDNVEKAIH
jgi:hypothetical protein